MTGFLVSRASWLRVETVDRGDDRWDVVLRIDGTYLHGGGRATKAELVEFFTDLIRDELGEAALRAHHLTVHEETT